MDPTPILFIGAIILFIGFFGEVIFKRTRIPDVVWLLLLGVALSFLLGTVEKALVKEWAAFFGTIALIVILFSSGLTLNLKAVVRSVPRALVLSLVASLFSAAAVAAAAYLFGWPLLHSLLLGIAVGGTSSAIAPALRTLKLSEQLSSLVVLESTINDVYTLVFGMAVVQMLSQDLVSNSAIQVITSAFGVGLLVGLVSGVAWLYALARLETERKSYVVTLAALFFIYVLAEFMKGNGALAVLMFGLVLGNREALKSILNLPKTMLAAPEAKFFFSEMEFFIKTFFFVYLGLLLQFDRLDLVAYGLAISALLFIVRKAAVEFSLLKSEFTPREKTYITLFGARGLTAAVLIQLPVSVLGPGTASYALLGDLATIGLSVIFFSTLIMVGGIWRTERKETKPAQSKATG